MFYVFVQNVRVYSSLGFIPVNACRDVLLKNTHRLQREFDNIGYLKEFDVIKETVL